VNDNNELTQRVKKIIVEGDYELLVKYAEQLGEKLAQNLHKNCYNPVKKEGKKWYCEKCKVFVPDNQVEPALTTSQIRNIFGFVKQLQARYDPNKLRMLKPKLAYMQTRSGKGGKALRAVLTTAIDCVFEGEREQQRPRFQRLVDFFEATLAYHKAYGGRD